MNLLASRGLQLTILLGVAAAISAPLLVRRPALARRALTSALAAYCAAEAALALVGAALRWLYPSYLSLMEGTMVVHLERVWAGLPIYVEPTPDFVAFAYLPGLYLAAVPFAAILGPGLQALRLPSVLSWLGIGVLVAWYLIRRTGDRGAGLLGAGLWFSALGALDFHLDGGFPDSLLLFLALLATLVSEREDRYSPSVAALLWVLSFWTKQHGAVLGIGGMLFLAWRLGPRRFLAPLAIAVAGGPVAYLTFGAPLFGPRFLEFTFVVPSGWTSVAPGVVVRLAGFLTRNVAVLAAVALVVWSRGIRRARDRNDAVLFLLPFALATGLMGAMDTGSTNNVLAAAMLWCILVGVRGLAELWRDPAALPRRWVAAAAGTAVSIGLLAFPPTEALPGRAAAGALQDLESVVDALDGPVYWPMDGRPLVRRERAPMEAHWVALEDLVRGPRATEASRERVLRPLIEPLRAEGPLFIFSRWRLEDDVVFAGTARYYDRIEDFGDRFKALRTMPDRYGVSYPRFLYRRRPGAEPG